MFLSKQKLLFLVTVGMFYGIQTASPMFGGRKDELSLANEANATSVQALNQANNAGRKADACETKLQQIENRLDQVKQEASSAQANVQAAVQQAAQSAANQANNKAEARLKALVKQAENATNNAEKHKNQAKQIENDVEQKVRDVYYELQGQMQEAAIKTAKEQERAKQKIQNDNEQLRQQNELKLNAEKEKQRFETENKLIAARIPLVKEEAEAKARGKLLQLQEKMKNPNLYNGEVKMKEEEETKRAAKNAEEETKRHAAKWNKINEMIDRYTEPKKLAIMGTAVVGIGAGIYAAKYGLPVVISHLVQPRVVSETSKKSWFGYKAPTEKISMDDLTFAPALQKQLLDIADRVQTAQLYDENLPNVMFYGPPGTGKTAFAKALAYCCDVDYALTSGSEFAKITDLNLANKELRKLIDWGKVSDKGLVIFIDEAESLFANRKLPTTSKSVQDFINTFLALIPEKSQKNLMFIFATNHPFKLDDAITNRVGISVEFTLPEAKERTKILTTYLQKFAGANPDALVTFDPVVEKNIEKYADALQGLAPRAIKYVAEEMVVYARRQQNKQLTNELAQQAIKSAVISIQQADSWAVERDKWVQAQMTAAAA